MTDQASTPHAKANPYAAPAIEQTALEAESDDGSFVTPRMAVVMRQTAPWAFAFGALLLLFAGLAALVFGAGALNWSGESGASRMASATALLLLFLVFTTLLAAAVTLIRYGWRSRRFARSRRLGELEAALRAQTVFWRISALGLVLLVVSPILLGVLFVAFLAAQS